MSFIKKIVYLVFFIFLLIVAFWFKSLSIFEHEPPRELPWTLPNYKQAKTSVEILDDGRIKISIEHLPLIGIKPKMIAWFYQKLPVSTVEISEHVYSWYHIFHPSEHGVITVKENANNGLEGMGIGALVYRQEWFGIYNSKGTGRIIEFSEQGMVAKPELLGMHFGEIKHSFTQKTFTSLNGIQELGTQYNIDSTIGSDLPVLGLVINYFIRKKMFSEVMINEWLRHQVEEVASLQFFLRELYRTKPQGNHYKLSLKPPQNNSVINIKEFH